MTTPGTIDVRRHGDAPAAAAGTPVTMSAELQRLWQDVFDQSRVVPAGVDRPAPEAAAPRRAGSAPARGQAPQALSPQAAGGGPVHAARSPLNATAPADAARAAGSGDHTPDAPVAPPALAATGLPAAAGRGVPMGTGAGIAVDRAMAPGDPAAPASGPLPVTVPAATARLRSSTPFIEADEARAPDATAAAAAAGRDEAPPDEVIQVFQHDGALEIVIRDSALDPQAALRCALETARQLTGDARSLRQLTLNGRTVLAHDGRAAGARVPRPLVSFSC